MSKYWFCFFIGAVIIAMFGPGLMPIVNVFTLFSLIFAAVLLFVLKNSLKNPRRMIEKYARRKHLSGNYFEFISKNIEKFRKIYLFPFAGAMSVMCVFNVLFAVITVTVVDTRPEFLQFLPVIIPDNRGFIIAYLIIFALLVIIGTVLFLIRLYSTTRGLFKNFGDAVNAWKDGDTQGVQGTQDSQGVPDSQGTQDSIRMQDSQE